MKNSKNSDELKGEHWKSRWMHPYALFIYLNILLALALLLIGYIAHTFGWLPDRRIG